MILPTESSHDFAGWQRQLLLDVISSPAAAGGLSTVGGSSLADATFAATRAPASASAGVTDFENTGEELTGMREKSTTTITTRRSIVEAETSTSLNVKSATAGSSDESTDGGNILAQAVADSNLSWWQLICIAIAGALAIAVAVWAVFRHQRKKKQDARRRKEIEAGERDLADAERAAKEEEEAEKNGMARAKGKDGGDEDGSGSEWWSSESCDSYSDGGTIRGRRRRPRRRRDKRRFGHWDRDRYRRRRPDTYYSSDDSSFSYHESRNRRRRHRRSSTPSPSPTPKHEGKGKKGFRDSVFSTYQSMKSAAVKLKQVEMREKLKKQLEDEERIERARQEKIREANAEIERERAWLELEREKERLRQGREAALRVKSKRGVSGDSHELLIPPVDRPASTATTSTSRGTPSRKGSFPLPTPRRQGSMQPPPTARVRMPVRGATVDSVWPPPDDSQAHQYNSNLVINQNGKGELDSDIHNLLGTKRRSAMKPGRSTISEAQIFGSADNAGFVGQVVEVKPIKERPSIPKGGLAAPAPKGRMAKRGDIQAGGSTEFGSNEHAHQDHEHGWSVPKPAMLISRPVGGNAQTPTVIGTGGGKWSDRLKSRR